MPQQVFGSLANCAGEGLTPGDAVVENRYAEARPNAAAIIAACWSGGAIKTSFFRGLTGEVPGRSAKCRLADVRPFPRGVKRPQDEPIEQSP